MLRRLVLRDFVIVTALEVDFGGGFTVLTGETGAGKSILIDALQLALGSRGDAGVVREGAARADITAEFDRPTRLAGWLADGGFDPQGDDTDGLLLRRVIDAQGKSRAWINGGSATVAQLREVADHLVDIHGQHAWQSLTRPAAVRALLDEVAGVDPTPLADAHGRWRSACELLSAAVGRQTEHLRELERLNWQITELERLAPGDDEWDVLNTEHRRLSHAQSLIDAARTALGAVSDDDTAADPLTQRAIDALAPAVALDASLNDALEALRGAQAQLQDAAHSLGSYLHKTEPEPDRLQELDERLAAWMGLARRYRRPPAELPALLAQWHSERAALDAASDAQQLQAAVDQTRRDFDALARQATAARRTAAPRLAAGITQAMQQLGMAGGRFEVALVPHDAPQSHGAESVEFLVAGHEGSTPRPLGKVASGGELSRLALAVAVTTSAGAGPSDADRAAVGTLIFDEIDSGVGGAVADTVGRLMKQLGRGRQVMAVTHLPQVAACADQHLVVSKSTESGQTRSAVKAVAGEARVAEIARMLGGERLSSTSLAHAQEMLGRGLEPMLETSTPPASTPDTKPSARTRSKPR